LALGWRWAAADRASSNSRLSRRQVLLKVNEEITKADGAPATALQNNARATGIVSKLCAKHSQIRAYVPF
jgi:hypothetical protein